MNKDKQAFFAQYWGQEVHRYPDHINVNTFVVSGMCGGDDYLSLKPLSSITDEDAIEVAKILEYPDDSLHTLADVELHIEDVMTANCAGYSDYVSGNSILMLTDFLRSCGYLLPFRNYTTDQLIEMGWAKIEQ